MITARWVAEAMSQCVGCPPYREIVPGGFGGTTCQDLTHALGVVARRVSHCGPILVRRRYFGAPENPAAWLLRVFRQRYPGFHETAAKDRVAGAFGYWQSPTDCLMCNGGLSNQLVILKDQKCPECGGTGYRSMRIGDEPTRWLAQQMNDWEWEVLGMMARLLREEFEDEWERASMN